MLRQKHHLLVKNNLTGGVGWGGVGGTAPEPEEFPDVVGIPLMLHIHHILSVAYLDHGIIDLDFFNMFFAVFL